MDTSADVLELIGESYKTFSKGQRYIADYITANYDKAVDMTAARLGSIVGVSESTVVRFATELGFKGYPQFQKALGELVKKRLSSVQRISLTYDRLSESDDLVNSVIHNDIQQLKRTADMLDRDAFYQSVDLIGHARRIYVIGGRSCSSLASFFCYYLNYIFDDVRLIYSDSMTESIEEIHRISDQDVIIAISFPRYSTKTVQTMSFARKRNSKIIAITDGPQSPLAQYADCSIYAGSDMISFVDSYVAPLSVINALLAALSMRYKDSVIDTMASMESIWNELNEYEQTE
jgi:DNA-binding MurR/RpiR family transcriptional regulator